MITTASIRTLENALKVVNTQYGKNIIFREIKQISKNRVQFTLRTVKSRAPGSRISYSGRHIPAACWHVHGHFFEAVFAIDTSARIKSGNRWITREAGNWEDRNIGSIMRPMYHSEACECGGGGAELIESLKAFHKNPWGR